MEIRANMDKAGIHILGENMTKNGRRQWDAWTTGSFMYSLDGISMEVLEAGRSLPPQITWIKGEKVEYRIETTIADYKLAGLTRWVKLKTFSGITVRSNETKFLLNGRELSE